MHTHLTPFRTALGVVFTTTLLLTACGGGGGGSGPAIKALPQTLTFESAPTLALGGSATVRAKSSSGLVVSYTSLTPTVCNVHASTGLVTNLAAGTCSIAADQVGSDDYAPAPQANLNLRVLVNPAQTLSFGTAPVLTLYGTATVSATASSELAVRYSSLTPTICTVQPSSGVVTSLAAGNCSIAADQPGDANYNAAAQVSQTLTVADGGAAVTPPGVPTAVAASLGAVANAVEVRFVGPAVSGGSPITGYSVVSSPAGLSGSGNASPITVTCPSACTGYTFTVQASNRAGASAPSARPRC